VTDLRMDILAIRIFVQTADAGSLVAAGRHLGISASGVGKSIQRLEQGLGVRLFHRSTRSITLTAEGELFLERARRILAEVDAAQDELHNASGMPSGRLRIGLPMIGAPFLDILADFQQRYPDVELDLDFDNRHVDVIAEGFDAVIRTGTPLDSRLHVRELGAFRMLVVGTPAYFERHGKPATPADLANHGCIQFRMPNTGKLQGWQFQQGPDVVEPVLKTKLTCNTNEARLHFAMRGMGIAYMSDFSVRGALASGELVSVLDEFSCRQNSFRLLWPSGRHAPPKLRTFIDFVSGHAGL
jgi:DNA-binding transcriptional LysR family regulator